MERILASLIVLAVWSPVAARAQQAAGAPEGARETPAESLAAQVKRPRAPGPAQSPGPAPVSTQGPAPVSTQGPAPGSTQIVSPLAPTDDPAPSHAADGAVPPGTDVAEQEPGAPPVLPEATTLPSPQPSPPMGAPVFAPPSPALSQGWAWVDTVPNLPTEDDEPPERMAFRGSRFDWTHSATTTLLGIGADYQSSAYRVYRQGYTLLLNYFVYDGDAIRFRVTTAPGFDVEMTNSDITTTQREPWFRDLPVALGVTAPLMRDESRLVSTIVGGNLVVVAPTSKLSRASGYYLTVSPRVNITQQVPLRGPSATLFNDMELWLQLRYDHLFSRGATPLDPDLNWPRRTGGASAPGTLSDVLNGSQIAPNTVRIEGSAALNEVLFGRPLTFTISADYSAWFLAGVTTAPASPYTDAVEPNPDARTVRHLVGVGVDLTWQVLPAMSLSLGYGNTADLGNVPSNNPLYTPYAAFLAGLVVHVDSVLESIIYQDRKRAPLTRRDLATAGYRATW